MTPVISRRLPASITRRAGRARPQRPDARRRAGLGRLDDLVDEPAAAAASAREVLLGVRVREPVALGVGVRRRPAARGG